MAAKSDAPNGQANHPRPWYRLHLSTYVILVLAAGILVLLIVPGDYRGYEFENHDLADFRDGRFPPDGFAHGWPLTYLGRTKSSARIPRYSSPEIPWLSKEAWVFTDFVGEFSPWYLAIDVLVAVALLVLAATAVEWRRRRRQNVWQFGLRQLLLLFVVVAGVLGWWQTHRRRLQRETQAFAAIRANGADRIDTLENPDRIWGTAYCGPKWLRKLAPRRWLRSFDTVAELRLTDEHGELDLTILCEKAKSLPNLKRVDLFLLFGQQQTNDDLARLKEVPKLRFVFLDGTGIEDGVSQLQQAQPNCRIADWSSSVAPVGPPPDDPSADEDPSGTNE